MKYLIQSILNAYKQEAESHLKKTEQERKEEIIQKDKKKNHEKKEEKQLTNEELEIIAKNWIQYAKSFQEINLDSIKEMYDLIHIKEEGTVIVVDFNPKN